MTNGEENPAPAPSPAASSVSQSEFIFVVCQNGAEAAARLEILSNHPNLRLAFSRPGFITFKVEPESMSTKFVLRSTLARTYGWSIGRCEGEIAGELIEQMLGAKLLLQADRLHVYQRDLYIPGRNGFEPGISPLAAEIGLQLEDRLKSRDSGELLVNRVAKVGQLVFDIVVVEPNQWWYGFHYAETTAGRWVGGVPQLATQSEVFSRAYFKLQEALLWSGLHIQPGDVCAEIGSAPGGACQLLLEKEALVLGIDPAEMELELLKNKNFTHIRRRVSDVKHRDFRPVKWLFVDMNIDPQFTLETVRQINAYQQVNIKGMVLTMKLADWSLVKKIPELTQEIKGLGFQIVKTRQLAFNRQEYCLVAIKNKFVLRDSRRSGKTAVKLEAQKLSD